MKLSAWIKEIRKGVFDSRHRCKLGARAVGVNQMRRHVVRALHLPLYVRVDVVVFSTHLATIVRRVQELTCWAGGVLQWRAQSRESVVRVVPELPQTWRWPPDATCQRQSKVGNCRGRVATVRLGPIGGGHDIGVPSPLRWNPTSTANVDGAVLARTRRRKESTYPELEVPVRERDWWYWLGKSEAMVCGDSDFHWLFSQSKESGGVPCVAEEGRTLLMVPVGIPFDVSLRPNICCIPALFAHLRCSWWQLAPLRWGDARHASWLDSLSQTVLIFTVHWLIHLLRLKKKSKRKIREVFPIWWSWEKWIEISNEEGQLVNSRTRQWNEIINSTFLHMSNM